MSGTSPTEPLHLGEYRQVPDEPARRRRRWPRTLAIVAAAVLLLGVIVAVAWSLFGDRFIRAQVEQRIRDEVLALQAVPDDAEVEVEVVGGEIVPQLMAGTLERVRIEVSELRAGEFAGSVVVQAAGVPLESGLPIDEVEVSLDVPTAVIEERVRGSLSLVVEDVEFLSGTLVRLSTTLRAPFLEVPASVTLELSARDGETIGLQPTDVGLGEQHMDPRAVLDVPVVGALAAPLLEPIPLCVADLVPAGFSLEAISSPLPPSSGPASTRVTLSARDLVPADAALSGTGTC